MENYLECWNNSTSSSASARCKKFSAEDENQFLEVKKPVWCRRLELILSSVEVAFTQPAGVHELVGNAPSVRYLSEMNEGVIRNLVKFLA